MRRFVTGCALLVALWLSPASVSAAPAIGMRPYAGIGLLLLHTCDDGEPLELPRLYDGPGMLRLEQGDLARAPHHEWIFALGADRLPLLVMARRGGWLKVTYDDAGREGWIRPRASERFQSWDEFWEGRVALLLPGLQKRYYRRCERPGGGENGTFEPRQPLRVAGVDDDWLRVEDGRGEAAWVRWRDEDGRLLVGLAPQPGERP